MTHRPDDELRWWEDDPLVVALTAPGTPDELANEDKVTAAFRQANRPRSRRRTVGRLGTGGLTILVAGVLSGGVAAAYGSVLPAPLQDAVHDWLGPVGVPPADDTRSGDREPSVSGLPSPTPSVRGTAAAPSDVRSIGDGGQVESGPRKEPQPPRNPAPLAPSPRPALVAPGSSPSAATPTPVATPTPSPTPTVQPAALTMSVARTRVEVGRGDRLTGRLTAADGTPIADYRVRALAREVGTSSWHKVARGRTDATGQVVLRVHDLQRNVRFRLAVDGIRSDAVKVVVLPLVTVVTRQGSDGYDVRVSARGADPGDVVVLQRLRHGEWRRVGASHLNQSGGASFAVSAPKHDVRYRAVVKASDLHGAGKRTFRLGPAGD